MINKCIDCNKEIDKRSKRCRDCAGKTQSIQTLGKPLSEEHRQKIIESNKRRKGEKRSKEVCERLSEMRKGKNNPAYKDGKSMRNICPKCGKLIPKRGAEFCRNCRDWSLPKGTNSPHWKGGKPKCLDCGKQLSDYRAKRCKKCTHKNKDYRKKLSIASKGINNPMFGKVTHGKWDKYKKIWMRSSWEIKYAKWLDVKKIKWEYESKTFDLGYTTYTPDFYLPKINEHIEIKGWWRDDAKEKFELFKKLYPKIKIKILDEKELKNVGVL